MHDFKVNIGGPKDQASQHIKFNVRYADAASKGFDTKEIDELLDALRKALQTATLPADDSRRVERSFGAIKDETRGATPNLKEIESSLGSVGRIVESVEKVVPSAVAIFRALSQALGFVV